MPDGHIYIYRQSTVCVCVYLYIYIQIHKGIPRVYVNTCHIPIDGGDTQFLVGYKILRHHPSIIQSP